MVWYRLIRYFVFLFLGIITALYLLRSIASPFPHLSDFFSNMDSIQESLSDQKNSEVSSEKIIQNVSDHFFLQSQDEINKLINDIRFQSALELAINYNFNDLEYLLQEYLTSLPLFRDVIFSQNNQTVFFKYRNIYLSAIISLKYTIPTSQGSIDMKVVFDQGLIKLKLSEINQEIFVKYNNQIFYSDSYQNIDQSLLDKMLNAKNEKGYIDISRKKHIYFKTASVATEHPMTFFVVLEKKIGWARKFLQFLFSLILPMIWILLIFIDRIIFRYFSLYKQRNEHKKKYAVYTDSTFADSHQEMDETLSWVDRFIKIEDLTQRNSKSVNQKTDAVSAKKLSRHIEKNSINQDELPSQSPKDE